MRRVRRRGRSFVPISPDKERRTRGGEAIPGRRREKKHTHFSKLRRTARCIGHRGKFAHTQTLPLLADRVRDLISEDHSGRYDRSSAAAVSRPEPRASTGVGRERSGGISGSKSPAHKTGSRDHLRPVRIAQRLLVLE